MKLAAIATLFLILSAAGHVAAEPLRVTPEFVMPEFTNKDAARKALERARQMLVGDVVKDTAGCLYVVAARGSELVLSPVIFDGSKVCSTKR